MKIIADDKIYKVTGRRIDGNQKGIDIINFVIGMYEQYGLTAPDPKTEMNEIIEWLKVNHFTIEEI